MAIPILQTKLFVPSVRPNRISRPNLLGKLDAGFHDGQKITLVSAPAGYGKTTLIAEWGMRISQSTKTHADKGVPALCWLSLDKYDDDPGRFWLYILAALRSVVPGIGSTTQQQLLSTPLPSAPALLTGLLNELADLPHSLILTLDDYHVIANKSIHEGLNFLLDHAPPPLHLVLITRADPPISLARWRGRSMLNEIRIADLRFTVEETAVFLRQIMGLCLSPDNITALETRTEGWITGLHLTAVSLRGRQDRDTFIKNFTTGSFYILEYLAEEVLQQQPESVQTFLLQTSILPELSAPLCDAVTGRDDSQAILDQLHRQNLFITELDGEYLWFRTHQLLAHLLRNRLRQTVSPEEVHALHRRASRWCAAHQLWEMSIDHAIKADDWEQAADLIAGTYQQLSAQGRIATWQRWLAQVPAPFIQARPALFVRQGWTTFLNGEFKQAEIMLVAARQKLIELDPSPAYQALRGELATYLATIAFFREEPDHIIAAAEEALAYLPPDALTSRARATNALGLGVSLAGDTPRAMRLFHETVELSRSAGNLFFLAHALEVVADGQYHTGQLRAAAATCQEIIALGTEDRAAPLPFAGNGHIKLASVYLEWGEIAKAEEQMTAGIVLNQQGGIGYNLLQDQCMQVRLRQSLGDQDGALAALSRAEAISRRNHSRIMAVQVMAFAVQFWLDAGDIKTAESWAEGRPPNGQPIMLDELPIIGQEVQQVALARVRLAQQRPDAVLAIYDQLHDQALIAGRTTRAIEIGLLAALAYQVKRKTAMALDILRRVLLLTQPEGFVQIFVESGESLRRLLCQIPLPEQTAYIQKLLRAFSDLIQIASTAMIDPLTPRELEVLRLIAAGLSNKQIAAEMTVSLNTVKKHTTHVYGKLAVSGRTQAVARARELNLL